HVPLLVEQHVLVDLDHAHVGPAEVLGHPVGAHQHVRDGVGVGGTAVTHAGPPFRASDSNLDPRRGWAARERQARSTSRAKRPPGVGAPARADPGAGAGRAGPPAGRVRGWAILRAVSAYKLAASVLAADFTRLGQSVQEAQDAGVEWLHLDVMDGHFVPNISFGPAVVAAVKRSSTLPLDVHLMIARPAQLVERFAAAGADVITVH